MGRGGGALHSTTASAGKRRPICDPPADVQSSMCPAGLARVPGSELGLALPLLLPAKNPAAACAADSAAWWQGTGPSSKGSWRSGPRPARPPNPRPPLSSHVPTRPSAPGRQPSPVTTWHSDLRPHAQSTGRHRGAGLLRAGTVNKRTCAPGPMGPETSSQRGRGPPRLRPMQGPASKGRW